MFPLLDTTFEGLPAKIPYRYKEILASEYGKASLSKTEFHEYVSISKDWFEFIY